MINSKVYSYISKIVTESDYQKFYDLQLLDASTIRLPSSNTIDLKTINSEIIQKLNQCINEYIQEAILRKNKFEEAYKKFDVNIQKRKNDIEIKEQELKSLSIFAFTKKRNLNNDIENMRKELHQYSIENEPRDLKQAYENMYR